jgi:hypothetical protein
MLSLSDAAAAIIFAARRVFAPPTLTPPPLSAATTPPPDMAPAAITLRSPIRSYAITPCRHATLRYYAFICCCLSPFHSDMEKSQHSLHTLKKNTGETGNVMAEEEWQSGREQKNIVSHSTTRRAKEQVYDTRIDTGNTIEDEKAHTDRYGTGSGMVVTVTRHHRPSPTETPPQRGKYFFTPGPASMHGFVNITAQSTAAVQ